MSGSPKSPSLEEELRGALELELPYYRLGLRPLTASRAASVLVLFSGESLLITRRTEKVEKHKGQMAFPGGMNEEGETEIIAALRETEEEVGIPRERVRVVGTLPSLNTFTGFEITPVVGLLEGAAHEVELRTSLDEIAEAFWIELQTLRAPGVYREEQYGIGPLKHPIHVYQVNQYRIWGATAAIIKNVLDRLELLKRGSV